MRQTRLSAAAVILCLLPACGMAQAMGQVQTDQGAPVPGFPVIIQGKDNSFIALTDEDGKYTVNDLPPGDYSAAPVNRPGDRSDFRIEKEAPCILDCKEPSTVIDTLKIPQNWSMY